tara:strand:- start:1227 stop:1844 length:618 start_codon:yes stop_codon:yes gene_type:complete
MVKKIFTISSDIAKAELGIPTIDFPKYTTQIINLAGSNSAATRPKVVGQMSDLTVESSASTLEEWRAFYLNRRPDAHQAAADKIEDMVENLREAMEYIDREMIDKWVDDLLINKTYYGFAAQNIVLEQLAMRLDLPLRQATPEDESRGIDGYLGGRPVSVKPTTYKQKALSEEISCPIIYYEKKSNGIRVDASEFFDEHSDILDL